MLYKTRGIVFHHFDYSESSVIVKIYTESFGLESYILKGVKKSKVKNQQSKINIGLLQHLSLVDLVVYHNERGGLQHIREIKSTYKYNTIPFDIKKSSVILFINEILYKTIKEEAPNKNLFEFIYNSLVKLDNESGSISDFHIHFIIQLTKYLGFHPNPTPNPSPDGEGNGVGYFNLREGVFQPFYSDERNCLTEEISKELFIILNKGLNEYTIPYEYRKDLLYKMIDYYRYHISELTEINSHNVLEAVFN